MSDVKKKKFSFFDLSDDDSFNSVTKEPEKVEAQPKPVESNVQEPQSTSQQQINNTQIIEPQKVVEEIKQPEPQVQIKQEESFYGKVEAFVPTKKEPVVQQEQVDNHVEEIKPQIQVTQPTTVKQFVQPQTVEQTPVQQQHQTNISNESLNGFFDVKEKLDVKTNIYIKKWIYDEIEQIHKRTNISRSSVINKLLEHALKELNKK